MEARIPKVRRSIAWLVLSVLLLFSIAAPLNQFKVPPTLPVLMESLGLTVSGAGMLMSVFAITVIALALPAGWSAAFLSLPVIALLGSWLGGWPGEDDIMPFGGRGQLNAQLCGRACRAGCLVL